MVFLPKVIRLCLHVSSWAINVLLSLAWPVKNEHLGCKHVRIYICDFKLVDSAFCYGQI